MRLPSGDQTGLFSSRARPSDAPDTRRAGASEANPATSTAESFQAPLRSRILLAHATRLPSGEIETERNSWTSASSARTRSMGILRGGAARAPAAQANASRATEAKRIFMLGGYGNR